MIIKKNYGDNHHDDDHDVQDECDDNDDGNLMTNLSRLGVNIVSLTSIHSGPF